MTYCLGFRDDFEVKARLSPKYSPSQKLTNIYRLVPGRRSDATNLPARDERKPWELPEDRSAHQRRGADLHSHVRGLRAFVFLRETRA